MHDEKPKESETDRKKRRREEYLAKRTEENKEIRKLKRLPRHILVSRVMRRWSKLWRNFGDGEGRRYQSLRFVKSLSSVTLRCLLIRGRAPKMPEA